MPDRMQREPSASRSSAGFRALVQRHHELAGWGARKLRHPLKGDRRRKAQNRLEVGADFGFVCRSERTLGYESHHESSDIALPDLELLNPFSRGERPEQRPRRKLFSVSIDKQVDLTAENFSDGRQRSSARAASPSCDRVISDFISARRRAIRGNCSAAGHCRHRERATTARLAPRLTLEQLLG